MKPQAWPPSPTERAKAAVLAILYAIAGLSADALCVVCRILRVKSIHRPASDYQRSDVDDIPDSALRKLVNSESLSSVSEEGDTDEPGCVYRLTGDTVVKFTYEYEEPPVPESTTLDLVFRHTTIPVPRVRRVIPDPEEGNIAIVMDYIPGRPLNRVWPHLSLFKKLRVALTVRDYIQQLRAIRHPRSLIPGPVALGTVPLGPRCQMMTGELHHRRPKFSTYAEFSQWWNNRYAICMKEVPEIHVGVPRERFDDTKPLVLSHCDLNMHNFLVGDDGRLYLIDWEMSGFYPEWFEYVNLRYWLRIGFREFSKVDRTDRLWNLLIPFMTLGPYFRQERWFYRTTPVLHYRN